MNELTKVEDLQLTAKTPAEMLSSQAHLVEWCDKKLAALEFDVQELKGATEHAKKNKWKWQVHERHWKLAEKRLSFYQKVKAALIAGYYIVPNFPVQMFAIKTKRNYPNRQTSNVYWSDKKQDPQELKIGDGIYQNPFPIVERISKTDEHDTLSYATEWDEMEFPVSMAKPDIMEATTRAMALKIFDEIGVFPDYKRERGEDPVIIGRIIRKTNYSKKVVSFMIAWHLNTNQI